MFGLQPIHIVFIFAIGLLIFGPARFGNLGRAFGKMFTEFRAAVREPVSRANETPAKTSGAKGKNAAGKENVKRGT